MAEVKLSIIIPYMEAFPAKREILARCVKSLSGHDELIVVSNWREGYAKPINKGLAIARGEFLLVMNDDIYQTSGNLKDLCNPEAVTSPLINERAQDFWGCCFCIPRWVYEKVGGLDEGYEISYFDDDDYIMTLKAAGIPMRSVSSVNFANPNGGTTLHTFENHDAFYEANKRRFEEKWKSQS